MRKILILAILIVSFSLRSAAQTYEYLFQDPSLPVETRVKDLLSQLTLDEKLSLMVHQNPAVERIGLPAYSWWNEALHGVARNGYAHVYPMPIALAATFDTLLIEQLYHAIACEARYKHYQDAVMGNRREDYTGLTFFTPNINIFRDPRWGRGMETFGEDPFLTSRMGLAVVRGLQGNDPNHLIAAACIKHLAVHSGPEGVRHKFDARVSPRDLWTTYLPAFEYIVKHSDVQQVMCGYNRLNGVPCCTNRDLLIDILRRQWHYNNILVTDCWALNDCWERDTVIPRHKTHPTAATTAADAFGSEVDLECGSGLPALRTAIDSGYITEAVIDQHVARILRTRFLVGVDDNNDAPYFADTAFNPSPLGRTIVMLKRSKLLPLHSTAIRQLSVVGPNADDSVMLCGNYNGTPRRVVTVRKGIENHCRQCPTPIATYYHPMCPHVVDSTPATAIDWNKLKNSDAIIFVGGLSPELEGEELQVELPGFHRGDRTAIELPEVQRRAIKEIKRRTGKPIILVLCSGSTIALADIEKDVDAIFVAWYGGELMGQYVAQALTDPHYSFGRLPLTFYRSTSDMPAFDDYRMQGRTYRYIDKKPLYPFGYGLEYADFELSDLRFDASSMQVSGTVKLKAGTTLGSASTVVQLYVRNLDDKESPLQSLSGFARVDATSQGTPFTISLPIESLRIFDAYQQALVDPRNGTHYQLSVGFSSDPKSQKSLLYEY